MDAPHWTNRLTESDRERITRAVSATLRTWTDNGLKKWTPNAVGLLSLDRIAYGSIGCSADDLRDVELAEIAATVRTMAGVTE